MRYFDENRIYLDETLCKKLDELHDEFLEIQMDVYRSEDEGVHTSPNAWNKLHQEIPALKKEIEAEFRKLLGEENSPTS